MNPRRMSARLYKLANRTRPSVAAPVPASAGAGTPPAGGPSLVDSGIYLDGKRVSSPTTLPETFRELNRTPGSMAWIGLVRPEASELQSLAAEFDLHELAVEDAVLAHQRSKLER